MTASQLSRATQKMLDGATTEQRQEAKEHYENAYNICKLHLLGLVQPKEKSHATISGLYQRLIAKGLGKYL